MLDEQLQDVDAGIQPPAHVQGQGHALARAGDRVERLGLPAATRLPARQPELTGGGAGVESGGVGAGSGVASGSLLTTSTHPTFTEFGSPASDG